ncbi:MAG: hypothetical protein K5872_18290 [Rhizobiaceae bacterium]|nr:hypothetical protein [Rhizobiaceae bacterium]
MTASQPIPSPVPFTIDAAPSLEAVELELALQLEDVVEDGFETALEGALRRVGGQLFFHLRVDTMPNCQRVAAASVGAGDERQLVLVILPDDGGPIRVEAATEEAGPLAGFARSYAGLFERL